MDWWMSMVLRRRSVRANCRVAWNRGLIRPSACPECGGRLSVADTLPPPVAQCSKCKAYFDLLPPPFRSGLNFTEEEESQHERVRARLERMRAVQRQKRPDE